MQPYPVRLPESLIDDLDDEADERDLGTAEYIRQILRQRDTTQEHTQEYTQRIEDHEQRLDDVEARLSALEAEDHDHGGAPETGSTPDDQLPSSEQESPQRAVSASQHTPDAEWSPSVDASADSLRAEAEQAAEAVSIKGHSADLVSTRREALLWTWEYLRDRGSAQSSEIADATFHAFDDLGYSAQEQYDGRGLWQGYLRDALRELPHVHGPPPKGRTWEFVEDGVE